MSENSFLLVAYQWATNMPTVEIISIGTRVRYGVDGAPKNAGPGRGRGGDYPKIPPRLCVRAGPDE